ncbi:Neuroblastoma-amplified sequence [Orchesella cincta]|uniref:Neuroblastoma-amplified sequence n=1 Tax=Orchesella cincta TaxID=48709 RepID=A0A1D2NBR7_ORCCI|nr:Neuroblastoma-amplified sequence [Orchesella cincta]
MYVADLLKSGSAEVINLARDFFDKTVEKPVSDDNSFSRLIRRVSSAYSTSFALYLYQIPYAKGLQMVLDAAQNYFDSSTSYSDPDIDLAKNCLNVMQDLKEPQIAQMFDLIDAVKILNKDFHLEILPLTVRLTRDKIALVKTAMDNMNGGYKKIQQLLKLILFLHPEGLSFEDAESLILDMSGSAALVDIDMKFCAQVCQNIVAKGYQTGWKIFVQLAKDQSDPPVLDHESKLASINYALNMCPNDEIFNVLNAKCLIEMRSLQSRVAELSPEDQSGELEESFIEEQDEQIVSISTPSATTPISLNPLKLHEFISATSKLININPVKGVASAVKSGGDALFQGAKTLLKTSKEQSGWEDDDDLDLDELLTSQDIESKNISMTKESFPIVYFIAKQLVLEILPEDIPLGLAILLSIKNVETLEIIFAELPLTPLALAIILYSLSVMIQRSQMDVDHLFKKNPNQLISETEALIEEDGIKMDEEENISRLITVFKEYKVKLADAFS